MLHEVENTILMQNSGIIIARFPNEMSTDKLNEILVDAITSVQDELPGNLTIIEPDRIRMRRRR